MATVIRRAMQEKPADRYQSADEMLLAIENVQRTVYRPAGQTELKRWLADLQGRDHVPSFGRARPAKAAPSIDEELDVGEGADVVFDQSDLMEVSEIMRGMQPTIAAPAPPAEPLVEEAPVAAKTTTSVPAAPGRKPSPLRRLGLGLVVLAALAGGVWLLYAASGDEPAEPHRAPRAKTTATRTPTGTRTRMAAKAPAPVNAIDAGTARVVSPVDSQPPESEGAAPPAEEEEDLLKNAEPESSDRVIGEDDAVAKAKKKLAPPKEGIPPEAVSVHIVSVPEGAVVSIGKRVFGRAPLHLRFRPGITYELNFVKKGYKKTTKRLFVSKRAKQTVKVALRKKKSSRLPAPKKSLLRRIFGG
jgi:hypothetical protein